ncbi:MAG: outer membrane lipid asymmetry maintenance protein MlaD [Turneriella sp.]|nr:outer membrane lipid asymmetry maintenance protein MlaD [Leptospiraceae bacterium]MCX7631998.1 outer membrane lipid asymmetry maintenance protein MlaD [Turneriella sp.]
MRRTEIYTGIFLVTGFTCFAWIALSLGGLRLLGDSRHVYYAEFQSVSGLKPGAIVEIAGVQVGNVTDLILKDNRARLVLRIEREVKLPVDSIAAIRTRGLIGEKFVRITPGSDSEIIPPGGEISDTESVVDLEEMIGKFIYDKK